MEKHVEKNPNISDILDAKCHYYWPFLRIIWDPPSMVHWFKALNILENDEPLDRCIPASLILAAARFGHAGIRGQQEFQSMAMIRMFVPLDPEVWGICEKYRGQSLKAFCENGSELSFCSWQPLKYNKIREEVPSFRSAKNAGALKPGRHLTIALKKDYEVALNYLAKLYERSLLELGSHEQNSPAVIRRRAYLNYNTSLTQVYVKNSGYPGEICAICHESLVDDDMFCNEIYATAICISEQSQPAWDALENLSVNRRNRTIALAKQRTSDVLPLEFLVNEPKIKESIENDLVEFHFWASGARFHMRDMEKRHPSKCVGAVRLACGHVFGLACIDMWLRTSTTCPLCRANLPKLEPRKIQGLGPDDQVQQAPLEVAHVELGPINTVNENENSDA